MREEDSWDVLIRGEIHVDLEWSMTQWIICANQRLFPDDPCLPALLTSPACRFEKYFMSQIAKCENVTSQVKQVDM